MTLERACNAQVMTDRLKAIDRRLCVTSAHKALIFRERMQKVLADAPRIGPNSTRGVFSVETVTAILQEAATILRALHCDTEA